MPGRTGGTTRKGLFQMATTKEKSMARMAADDGDSLAEQQYRDMMEEDGITEFRQLKRGQWVVIWTVTHCYRGRLVGYDHEEYVLQDVTQIFDSGELVKFYEKHEATQCEPAPGIHRVRKGGVIEVVEIGDPTLKNKKK